MKKARLKILSIISVLGISVLGLILFLSACDDQPPVQKKSKPFVVQKKIIPPAVPAKSAKSKPTIIEKKSLIPDKVKISDNKVKISDKTQNKINKVVKTDIPVKKEVINYSSSKKGMTPLGSNNTSKSEHYNAQGKIDPFKPLIQDKTDESVVVKDNKPKRILTPLEKVDLSQIRLVAVILMKNRKIAMVEEGSGKGYEVGIGTYIGRNQGRISEILSSSIVVKELIKDYKGRLKERKQEIQLHKSDEE